MQRDVADWVTRCGQCTLSKASARVMDPGHLRTRPVSALFETLNADVLELSIPSRGYRDRHIRGAGHILVLLVPLKTQQHSEEIAEKIVSNIAPPIGRPAS